MTISNRIRLTAGSRVVPTIPATRVELGPGTHLRLGQLASGRRAIVIADRRALAHHRAPLLAALGPPPLGILAVGPGERAKQPRSLLAAWEALARTGLRRDDLLVGFGGGATLDLAGFLAATWMRGIAWIALPTTPLAQADACLGGKSAIDLARGKNLIGAFHFPEAALCDPLFLATVPRPDHHAAGFELLKCAWIGDRRLARVAASRAWATREPAALVEGVARALRVKARLVAADPFDRGDRRLLNLGHTFGHALEAASGFRLRHGFAVGIGLLAAAHAAQLEGLVSSRVGLRLRREVLALEPPRVARGLLGPACRAVAGDKKAGPRGLALVLPSIRGVQVREGLSRALFREALAAALEEGRVGPPARRMQE